VGLIFPIVVQKEKKKKGKQNRFLFSSSLFHSKTKRAGFDWKGQALENSFEVGSMCWITCGMEVQNQIKWSIRRLPTFIVMKGKKATKGELFILFQCTVVPVAFDFEINEPIRSNLICYYGIKSLDFHCSEGEKEKLVGLFYFFFLHSKHSRLYKLFHQPVLFSVHGAEWIEDVE
jgi:hypothetical protein